MRYTCDSRKTLPTSRLRRDGRLQVAPEGLLDDDPAPAAAVVLVIQPHPTDLLTISGNADSWVAR